jgi:hypothetical protein
VKRALLLTAASLVALVFAATVFADGDPASDFLLSSDVFLGYKAAINAPAVDELQALTVEARQKKVHLKVVLITEPRDLGSVPSLYGHAQSYADFLRAEIRFVFKGTLVVVMGGRPGGLALSGPKATAAARRAVSGLQLPADASGTVFLDTGLSAVREVAAANGVTLTTAHTSGGHSSNGSDRLILAVAGLGVVAATLGFTFWRRRRRPASPG